MLVVSAIAKIILMFHALKGLGYNLKSDTTNLQRGASLVVFLFVMVIYYFSGILNLGAKWWLN